ncbi:MAG: N-acetyltransferase [Flavobacteriaceae bacterium]|nr:N-acetyltransferase [Flavobacteriaceae bacterium]
MPIVDSNLGSRVIIHHPELVNIYGCEIADGCKIGSFVEIQKNVTIGENCKISSHSFICEGVKIQENVFLGHGVMFINDRFPKSTDLKGKIKKDGDWELEPTYVEKFASIGTGAIILCGVTIGQGSLIGAGAVVTNDVMPFSTVAGVPARLLSKSSYE